MVVARLPLVDPWVTRHGVTREREVLLVRAVMGDGAEGWGECVAPAEPAYSSEYLGEALLTLRDHLLPRLLEARPAGGAQVAAALAEVRGHQMAKAALETALLDAELRRRGASFADHLWSLAGGRAGERPKTVRGAVAVGLSPDPDTLVAEVARRIGEGYTTVKLKIRPGGDVMVVAAVRSLGADLDIQVDANESYAGVDIADAATTLRRLEDHGVSLIEQPLGGDDLLGHAALARAIATPICLDESATSVATVETAIHIGACRAVSVKAGRLGGYLEAVRLHDRCRVEGVPVRCGGMLETGVGRAANLALAVLPDFSIPGDLSGSDRFFTADIVDDPARLSPDGTIRVPEGPGLGVRVSGELAGVAVEREWWDAGRS
jgi:O-succinylbenzoate synthase